MNNKSIEERMATDDIFFSTVIVFIGIYASIENWQESDWIGLFGTALLFLFGVLWLSIRIFHLTHKEEVFGQIQKKPR